MYYRQGAEKLARVEVEDLGLKSVQQVVRVLELL